MTARSKTGAAGMSSLPSYVLITPARNEERLIANTIQAVIKQTMLPMKWMIVSDGSTDRTDEIVSRSAADHSWIELIRMPEHRSHNFASKVHCFNAGYRRITQIPFDILGNLDADITFEPDYFEYLLTKFAEDQGLGVAGTPFIEGDKHYDYRYASIEHVSGACQLFRRECFTDVGGYVPVRAGGIDWIAVTTARMKGWKTRTFTERKCYHHRKIGTRNSGRLGSIFKYGKKNYMLGSHPLWQILRSLFHMRERPYVTGGMLLLSGYFWGFLTRAERPVSRELMRFYRGEQISKLKEIAFRSTPSKRAASEARNESQKGG